ncbi:MAG TPA: cohesin domain-containing protein [Gemmatimonadaceae bacterium]|nr:cohesin domain-containing protein [Gemmatimonadaceae bacterium]
MINSRLVRSFGAAAALALLGGCSESLESGIVQNPAPKVEAVLVVSDLAAAPGSSLVVSVKAVSTTGTIGSFTMRLNYDASTLRFEGELPTTDNALRALNATNGLLRFAGANAKGFTDSQLASYKFVVLKPNAARTLSLVIDEMHMLTRVDAKSSLTIAPTREASR